MPKGKKGNVVWDSTSDDGKLLIKLLQNAENLKMTPKQIQKDFPVFMKYKAQSFAQNVRRLRLKLGMESMRGMNGKLRNLIIFVRIFNAYLTNFSRLP